jgi:endogenous inhibitor of DNA gyrase (YacG/DUF329 family)
MARDEFFLGDTDLEILCPRCGQEMVGDEDTGFLEETPERATLDCGRCGEISRWEYSLEPRRLRQMPTAGGNLIPRRVFPDLVSYEESPAELLMTIKSFQAMYAVPMLLFAAAFVVIVIVDFDDIRRQLDALPAVVLAAFLAVFVYAAIAQVLNRTIIRVTPTILTLEQAGMPWSWPRRRLIMLEDIQELACKKRQRNHYALTARMKNGKTLYLRPAIGATLGEFIARRVNRFKTLPRPRHAA